MFLQSYFFKNFDLIIDLTYQGLTYQDLLVWFSLANFYLYPIIHHQTKLRSYILHITFYQIYTIILLNIWIISFVINRPIGLVGSVFAHVPGDRGSIPDRVIPKTFFLNSTWYRFA